MKFEFIDINSYKKSNYKFTKLIFWLKFKYLLIKLVFLILN